ncbi:UNVERIFIED_CONTAM: hypothetical protein RMT77_003190 [Armadillidium vulgare]
MSLGKIILRSTTRISLNDRFTELRNENPSPNVQFDSATLNRQMIQASRKNQRLAAQMERRPAVIAALKAKKNITNRLNGHQQQISVKQRLALPARLRIPESIRGSTRGLRRGFASRIRGGGVSPIRGKFQGRIGTESRVNVSFRGGRGGRFIGGGRGGLGGRVGQAVRGGQISRGGRGRGFSRGRSSRGFRQMT